MAVSYINNYLHMYIALLDPVTHVEVYYWHCDQRTCVIFILPELATGSVIFVQ